MVFLLKLSQILCLMNDLDNLKLLKVNEYSFCSETNLNQNLKVYQDIDADNDWYFWLYKNDTCIESLNDDNFLSLTFKKCKNKKNL